LILISYYLLGRFGKKTPLFAGANLGQILGRLYLSPRACLYFVKVKDRVLIVGVTPANISQVAELPADKFDAVTEKKAQSAASPGANAFLKELKSQVSGQAPDEVDDEIAALRGDLDRLQRYLQESTREIGG
jgi:flagellar biogenesis protein FliO